MKTIKISLWALATVLVVSCEKQAENTASDVAENTENTATQLNEEVQNATALAENTTAPTNPEEAPVLSLDSDTYDFGDVDASTKTEKVIEFINTGKSPLMIKNAKASCGCTVPEYSKEPIAPGEKGSLKVSYKAPSTNGKQTKTVTLTTNTAKGRETFKIKANVVNGKERQAPKPKPQSPQLPAPKLGQ